MKINEEHDHVIRNRDTITDNQSCDLVQGKILFFAQFFQVFLSRSLKIKGGCN